MSKPEAAAKTELTAAKIDPVATVMHRNAFYRDGYRMLLRITVVQLFVIGLLIASLVGMVLTVETRQVYFATTSDGRIIPIIPLSEPYRENSEVVTWAAETAKNVMRFDYIDYKARLQQVSPSFTPGGWESFNKALKDSNLLDALQARKLVLTMTVNAAPEIINSGLHNGIYTWDLRMPVTIKMDGAEPPQPINASLLLRVVRVSNLQNPDGISIEQWVTLTGQNNR
ncbi:MAG: DotI/IcmL/TraM family protein [Alphaproteobacteria bacterium]|nr:DotI/IcmL/TraM family protein [Alphaproteobacteria bacterium]